MFEALAIHIGNPVHTIYKKPRPVHLIRRIAIAASVMLFMIAGIKWSREDVYDELSSCHRTLLVPHEQSLHITLTDGTRLWLGSGTEVEIPQIFSTDRREIKLINGEVYLEVAEDKGKPFVVNTSVGDVKVLGTRFNIIVDNDNDYFSTALFEGAVKVSGKAESSLEYTLKPSEELVFDNGLWNIERITSTSATPLWIEGIIDIAGVSFSELMYTFERTYGVEIVNERKDIPQLNYTMGKIRIKDGIRHAMDMLKLSSDFDYKYDADKQIIYIR